MAVGAAAMILAGICRADQASRQPDGGGGRLEGPHQTPADPESAAKITPKGHLNSLPHGAGVGGGVLRSPDVRVPANALLQPIAGFRTSPRVPPTGGRIAPTNLLPNQRAANPFIGGPSASAKRQGVGAAIVNARAVSGTSTGSIGESAVRTKF